MKCVIDGCSNEATTMIGIDRDIGSYCEMHYEQWMLEWSAMRDELRKLSFDQICDVFEI